MLLTASAVLLGLFALFAFVDGVLVHLWWLKLHRRPSSYEEHLWHTSSAVLFLPILVLIFLVPTGGLALWSGISLVILMYVVEWLDVRSERESRVDLGGLSRGEFALHVASLLSRSGATALALAARPVAAWSPTAPSVVGTHPAWMSSLVNALLPGTLFIAIAHLWLAWRYRPSTTTLSTSSLR